MVHFAEWLQDALEVPSLRYPKAFCLSTIDEAGYPDGRFVDLKEVGADGFVFGTHLESRKAAAINRDRRVSLTFWWEQLGRQVRIAGLARRTSDEVADRLFRDRPYDAQLVSIVSAQSRTIEDPARLERALEEARRREPDQVRRPAAWGAYRVRPERMEFLRFRDSRLHERTLYVRRGEDWAVRSLQP